MAAGAAAASRPLAHLQLLAALVLRAGDLALRLLRSVLGVQGLLPVVCGGGAGG